MNPKKNFSNVELISKDVLGSQSKFIIKAIIDYIVVTARIHSPRSKPQDKDNEKTKKMPMINKEKTPNIVERDENADIIIIGKTESNRLMIVCQDMDKQLQDK